MLAEPQRQELQLHAREMFGNSVSVTLSEQRFPTSDTAFKGQEIHLHLRDSKRTSIVVLDRKENSIVQFGVFSPSAEAHVVIDGGEIRSSEVGAFHGNRYLLTQGKNTIGNFAGLQETQEALKHAMLGVLVAKERREYSSDQLALLPSADERRDSLVQAKKVDFDGASRLGVLMKAADARFLHTDKGPIQVRSFVERETFPEAEATSNASSGSMTVTFALDRGDGNKRELLPIRLHAILGDPPEYKLDVLWQDISKRSLEAFATLDSAFEAVDVVLYSALSHSEAAPSRGETLSLLGPLKGLLRGLFN